MGNSCVAMKNLNANENIHYGQCTQQKNSARIKQFLFIRQMKKSQLSSIFLVQNKRLQTYHILKVTSKSESARKNLVHMQINEQLILLSVKHPLIANMIQSFQDENFLYILLEFMPLGSLRDYMREQGILDEVQARFAMVCLLQGLEQLHKNKIGHFDLKPQNLVFDEKGYLRLCDFDLSVDFKALNRKGKLIGTGTYGYQAPEMYDSESSIGIQADLYSSGVVLVEMLTGKSKRDFCDFSIDEISGILQSRNDISRQCVDFIIKLVQEDPRNRIGSNADFNSIWMHPWLQLSDAQLLEYTNKQICSFIPSSYKKSKVDVGMRIAWADEQRSQLAQEELDARIRVHDKKFQQRFQKFKTIYDREGN